MFIAAQRPFEGATNFRQNLAYETRLNQLHRLFRPSYNVTEPSMILAPYLFLGNCISAQDVHRLSRLGIRYVLNVAKRDVETCPYYPIGMRTLTIDLRDDDQEDIVRAFDEAFRFIDEARKLNSRVLVHCSHGQSRSPTIVIGYLMRTYNASLEQCVSQVIKARPCVIPNDGFLKQLILFDLFLIDRRRRQQENAMMQAINNATSTEIPIQHHPPIGPQPPAATAVSAVPQNPANSVSNTLNMLSVSLPNMAPSSIQNIQPSTSGQSMHVIPIQVSLQESHSEKIRTNGMQIDVNNANQNVNKSEEKHSSTKLSKKSSKTRHRTPSPSHILRSKKRSSKRKMKDASKNSSQIQRSNTDNLAYLHVNHDNNLSLTLTQQQWDIINNYPPNGCGPNEHVQTNYITEVYDRETNQFIKTTCCY